MRKQLRFICLLAMVGGVATIFAQTGCPDCIVAVPATLPADTIYLGDAPNGRAGEYYEADISFRMPKTTTPVAANDSTIIPNITISQITITSVTNVPPGLSWEANQLEFKVSDETDGCVRFCGTPLQPGLYEIEVVVSAKVLIVTQTTSFSFPILIEPAVSVTEGFTMENSRGCGEVAVAFQNNISSNGQTGFSYKWDFGNGQTSTQENPSDQIYPEPGTYFVNYEAIVDTAGYFLTNLRVDELSCTDFLGNRPDVWVEILDPQGTVLYKSNVTTDARLPLNYNVNIPIEDGNYLIKITDDDDGFLGNDDDPCGNVTFNKASNGTIPAVEVKSTITIIHPVDTVRSSDTVRVYAQPASPTLSGYQGKQLCKGDALELRTNYSTNIQWFRNGESLIGRTDSLLSTKESGNYFVVYTSVDGCRAYSDTAKLNFAEPPAFPIFTNQQNYLVLLEPAKLPANYTVEWFFNGNIIPNAKGVNYCANASGTYILKITNSLTGCASTYSRIVTYDPGFAGCTTSTEDSFGEWVYDLKMFPNPTTGQTWLQFALQKETDATVIVRNAVGMEISRQVYSHLFGNNQLAIDLQHEPAGIYLIELQVQDGRKTLRLIKQ